MSTLCCHGASRARGGAAVGGRGGFGAAAARPRAGAAAVGPAVRAALAGGVGSVRIARRGGVCPGCLGLVSSMLLVAHARATPRPPAAEAFAPAPVALAGGRPGSVAAWVGRRLPRSSCPALLSPLVGGRALSSAGGGGGGREANFLRAMELLQQKATKTGAGGAEAFEERGLASAGEGEGEGAMELDDPSQVERELYEELSQGGAVDPNQYLQELLDERQAEEEYKHEGPKRCGTVAIVGAPNAGKSTLLNHLVGSKVAIVTHKRQTTRNSVTGIAMEDGTQVVYIDTPGIMDARPGHRLNKAMVKQAWNSARDADEVLFLVDADKILPGRDGRGIRGAEEGMDPAEAVGEERLMLKEGSNEELVLKRLVQRRQDFNLVLNKVDQVKGERRSLLLPLAEAIKRQAAKLDTEGTHVKRVYAVSALSGKGADALRGYLRENLPAGPWLYPPDQISDIPLRQIAAEITRESILLRAHEEVPYVAYVDTEAFQERPDGSVRIDQMIYVETEGQKRIIVGMIKDLGMRSRREIGKFLDQNVHLFLKVKIRKWTDTGKAMYERIGLDFDA